MMNIENVPVGKTTAGNYRPLSVSPVRYRRARKTYTTEHRRNNGKYKEKVPLGETNPGKFLPFQTLGTGVSKSLVRRRRNVKFNSSSY
jgi:hypothetical protein